MIDEQKKLHEINEMAYEYRLYLGEQGKSLEDIDLASTSLRVLYWQAGEQMAYLREQREQEPKNGKHFSMLVGFAYSILDGLEDAAERAMIGEKNGNGYRINSDTDYIKHKKVYGKRLEESACDYDYFKFLRSLICAHPIKTDQRRTIEGFISGKYAICQYVDFIAGNSAHTSLNKNDSDYVVRILDEGNEQSSDIYIVSNEIWAFIDDRFRQLIDIIHSTMQKRITEVVQTLKEKTIIELSDFYNEEELDALIKEDWHRGGFHHFSLMVYKVALKHVSSIGLPFHFCDLLLCWLWDGIKSTRNDIQMINNNDYSSFDHRLRIVLDPIGFDDNQYNNFNNLNTFQYGIDCDNYLEGGLDNYSKSDSTKNIYQEYIKNIYNIFQDDESIKMMNRQEKIEVISNCYRCTDLPRKEISRLFFIIVLPSFVEKYELIQNLIYDADYDLFIRILACAIDYANNRGII